MALFGCGFEPVLLGIDDFILRCKNKQRLLSN
jgi:hypothetical protein